MADARRRDALATAREPLGYLLDIALRDPASALDALGSPAWSALEQRLAGRNEPSRVDAWPLIRDEDYKLIRLNHKALLVGSLLLTMLAIASLAVLGGGRMAQQTRRVGLLKAVGATPGPIAATLLAENMLLAIVAAFAGVIAGELILPPLSNAGPAITAAFTAWTTVTDAQRSAALARAPGATPRQINTSLITAQLLAALPAATLGIHAGLLLYEVAGGHLSEAPPPLLSLLAVIPVTLAAVAVISAIPIRIGARRPVADILRAD